MMDDPESLSNIRENIRSDHNLVKLDLKVFGRMSCKGISSPSSRLRVSLEDWCQYLPTSSTASWR